MATTQPNHRASLLAGLRTGGVRSVSVPHTAAPHGSFMIPSHQTRHQPTFPEEEEVDALADMVSRGVHLRNEYIQPRTASCDLSGSALAYQQQQQWSGMQGHVNQQMHGTVNNQQFSNGYPNQQQVQLQMMQMEIMRLQALSQLQQYAQYQNDTQQMAGHQPFPVADAAAQMQAQPFSASGYPAQNGNRMAAGRYTTEGNGPMTAAIGGKFSGRRQYGGTEYDGQSSAYNARRVSMTNSGATGVMSGGAALGTGTVGNNVLPSKSDSAISWRSNSNDSTPKETSPLERLSMAPIGSGRKSPLAKKARPEPLEFRTSSVPIPSLAISTEASESSNDSSSTKSDGEPVSSTPTTPVSGNSNTSLTSAREEASKKLFQGLGMGRPSIHVTGPNETYYPTVIGRSFSQPVRQPRGPPAAAEELGSKNFANRIRKKAIGGLGALLEARERREVAVTVEEY